MDPHYKPKNENNGVIDGNGDGENGTMKNNGETSDIHSDAAIYNPQPHHSPNNKTAVISDSNADLCFSFI